MRIELKLHREGGSHVEFPASGESPARKYHFAPTETDPRHICDVDVPAHIQRLLSIEGYQLADVEPAPLVKPTAVPSPVPEQENGEKEPDPPPPPPAENLERVAELRGLSVRDLKAQINTFSDDELRAALTLEEADDKPRASWLAVVKAHLGV